MKNVVVPSDAKGNADVIACLADWKEPKLIAAGRALAALGQPELVATLCQSQGLPLGPKGRQKLQPSQLQTRIRAWSDLPAEEVFDKLVPGLRLAKALGRDVPPPEGEAFDRFPQAAHLWAWLLCHWHVMCDRPAEAVRAFESVDERQPCPPAVAMSYARSLDSLGRSVDCTAFLLRHADAAGSADLLPQMAYRYASALCRAGRDAQALPIFEALTRPAYGAKAIRVSPALAAQATEALVRHRRGGQGVTAALAEAERLCASTAANDYSQALRLRLIWRSSGLDAAEAAFWDAIAAAPLSNHLLQTALQIPFPEATCGRIAQDQAPRVDPARASDRTAARTLVKLALIAGRLDLARQIAERGTDHSPLTELVTADRLRLSPRLAQNWPELPFHAARSPGARAVLLCFPAVERLFGELPVRVFDSYLAERGIDVLYCHDASNQLFSKGAPGCGDRFEAVVAHLRAQPMIAQAPHLWTLGASLGGFTALRFGLALGAEVSLAFSAKTTLVPGPDAPRDLLLERAAPAIRQMLPEGTDLCAAWPGRTATRSLLFHGADAPVDLHHAQRLAGCAGVTLRPTEGVGAHNSLAPMILDGSFGELLDSLLETAPA
ncbi:hypothetical protein [Pseudooceanicola nanhaiensis]|uniref:hypothetical protein n=1 Tax=Pseudooceanicola nanhaiensis TaxID=375761 RepID=UPI001CD20AE9|nr:hypothetical protein [Pseudooceanicola nanhaiensis]MCA0920127.1 hypothetical protein [Pseudooceanicola nanhaiensis]